MTKIIKKKEAGTNRHWKNFLDKDYLGSHNLEEGEEMLLTIEKFRSHEQVKNHKVKEVTVKQVLYFKEKVPKMIMNITNGNTLSMLYGPHPDQWVGKKIQVYSTKTNFGKEKVDALRIRDFKPKEEVVFADWASKLDQATTLPELAAVWKTFPLGIREDKSIIEYKDKLKEKLTPKE